MGVVYWVQAFFPNFLCENLFSSNSQNFSPTKETHYIIRLVNFQKWGMDGDLLLQVDDNVLKEMGVDPHWIITGSGPSTRHLLRLMIYLIEFIGAVL